MRLRIYELMEKFFKAETSKFGVTSQEALQRTEIMIRNESEQVNGLTSKLKSYLNDLDAALAVFEAQEDQTEVRTVEELRRKEAKLTLLRSKVQNQVLIKNYNLSEFIHDMETTVQ